jgi:hypothetical protein
MRATLAAAIEIWAGAGEREGHGPLQGHARILRRSGGVRGGGDGGVSWRATRRISPSSTILYRTFCSH